MIYRSIRDLIAKEKAPELPVIIPTFNNLSYLTKMIIQLQDYEVENVIIIDNFSTLPGMSEVLDVLGESYIVVKKFTNDGPREFYTNKNLYDWLPEKFIVTDPDIGFNKNLPENFIDILSKVSDEFQMNRVGFALDIEMNDVESIIKTIPFSNSGLSMYEWEQQFYRQFIGYTETGDSIYRAPIDTTFCLVNKKYHIEHNDPMQISSICARIGDNFTAQHYGWYEKPPIDNREYEFYLSRVPPQWSFTSNVVKMLKGIK
jgi:hypothetical protein